MMLRVFEPDSIDEELVLMEERISEVEEVISFDVLDDPIGSVSNRAATTIPFEASVGDAIRTMQAERTGSLAVVDTEGRIVGIFTERDVLLKVVGKIAHLDATSIIDVMTPSPETLREDDKLIFAMNKMQVGGFRHVPIVDAERRPLHVLSLREVMHHVLRRFERRIETLPPEPYRGEPQLDVGYG